MANQQIAPSLVRTVVPVIVGFLLTQAIRVGLHLDQATLTDLLTTGLSAAYYAAVRLLEAKFGAKWGWLLGWATAPTYTKPAAPAPTPAPRPAPTPPANPGF